MVVMNALLRANVHTQVGSILMYAGSTRATLSLTGPRWYTPSQPRTQKSSRAQRFAFPLDERPSEYATQLERGAV